MPSQREMYLRQVLRELRAANVKLANVRDTLFGLSDVGDLMRETAELKGALQATITHVNRRILTEFPE